MKSLFARTTMMIFSACLMNACTDANMRFMDGSSEVLKSETPADGWIPGQEETTPGDDGTAVVNPAPVVDPPPVVVAPAPIPGAPPVVVAPAPTPDSIAKDDCVVNGLSQKACYLMKIMELGCPLRDSVPAGYKAPNRAKIISHMQRCDANAYPYTTPTAAQMDVINRLLDPNSDAFRKYIFTGLYYKPPYTDDFKKYFGVELYNAEYVFCDDYGVPPGNGSIVPKEAINNDNYVMDKAYKAANVYAGQLNACVSDSKSH